MMHIAIPVTEGNCAGMVPSHLNLQCLLTWQREEQKEAQISLASRGLKTLPNAHLHMLFHMHVLIHNRLKTAHALLGMGGKQFKNRESKRISIMFTHKLAVSMDEIGFVFQQGPPTFTS